MDNKDELIQVPTLSFPAYKDAKRPRWLVFLGAVVLLLGVQVISTAVMNYLG